METVFVVPGTVTAPRGGILKPLVGRYENVREAVSRIDKAARDMGLPDISPRLIDDDGTTGRRSPETHYLEIFAVSAATFHMLLAEGVLPDAVVGQSIGELWAMALTGHLGIEDAARLAVARSQALTRQAWDGKMLAVGVDGIRAEALAALAGHPELVVACENAPRQSVLSGPVSALEQVERVAEALGWLSVRLEVPHPTHTPAMAPAARTLRTDVPRVPYSAGDRRLCSPWLGRDVGDEDPVELVAGALTARVRMLHTIRDLHAAGANTFVECGEWPVVSKFVEASVPGVRCVVPLSEADPVQAARSIVSPAPFTSPPVTPSPVTPAPAPVQPLVQPSAQVPSDSPVPVLAATAIPAVAAPVQERGAVDQQARAAVPGGEAADYGTVLTELRALYGDFLGYPPDLLGEDDGLEAELGVESLKQVALLGRVAEHYGLPDLRADSSLLTSGTLGRIARAVVDGRAARG